MDQLCVFRFAYLLRFSHSGEHAETRSPLGFLVVVLAVLCTNPYNYTIGSVMGHNY